MELNITNKQIHEQHIGFREVEINKEWNRNYGVENTMNKMKASNKSFKSREDQGVKWRPHLRGRLYENIYIKKN